MLLSIRLCRHSTEAVLLSMGPQHRHALSHTVECHSGGAAHMPTAHARGRKTGHIPPGQILSPHPPAQEPPEPIPNIVQQPQVCPLRSYLNVPGPGDSGQLGRCAAHGCARTGQGGGRAGPAPALAQAARPPSAAAAASAPWRVALPAARSGCVPVCAAHPSDHLVQNGQRAGAAGPPASGNDLCGLRGQLLHRHKRGLHAVPLLAALQVGRRQGGRAAAGWYAVRNPGLLAVHAARLWYS